MVEMSETLNYVFFIVFKLVHRRSLILSDTLRCVLLSRMCWLKGPVKRFRDVGSNMLGATCWNRLNTMLDDVGRTNILGQHFKQMLDATCWIRLNTRLKMLDVIVE